MDQKELQNLIRFISKSGVAEVSFKTEDYELKVRNVLASPQQFIHSSLPVSNASNPPSAFQNQSFETETSGEVEETPHEKHIIVKSPMIGTFYRKPAPDKPFFVSVGDEISKGTVVCVIEAMKLFNEIESDVSGKIIKILVEDSMPVEYDQPLFLIDPS
jgi:acetyl-CoA carboxylase biotin carboxyl carrier protein